MRYRHLTRTAACAAGAATAVAFGLVGLPGAAAADPGQVNRVDLSIQQGGGGSTAPAAGASALAFSVHNAGPGDAAGPVEVDVVLVHTAAAEQGLPDGCATLSGSADQDASVVHCVLADKVPAKGAADVSIPLAGSSSFATGPTGLAMVHVWPAPGSSDVETNPLDNEAVLQT
jgi:hypothetical protein